MCKCKVRVRKFNIYNHLINISGPGGQRNLIEIEEGQSQEEQQRRQQILIQEENDIAQLQERERAVHQLESDILDVNTIFKVKTNIICVITKINIETY